MKIKKDNFRGLILADELINDYEFELRVHHISQIEDIHEYALNKHLMYSGYFD